MIYTITLNPALDKTVVIPSFGVDQVNRITQVRLDPGGKGVNVSKMIASLGGDSVAVAALGGMAGEQWKQLAESCGFSVHVICAEGETRTNVKVIDPIRHTNTDINEPGAAHELVSMGPDGALLCWMDEDHGMRYLHGSAPSVPVISTVGAGDSMVGAVAYGLEQNLSREEILRLAVAAGTAAVTCDGSQAPDEEKIRSLFQMVNIH